MSGRRALLLRRSLVIVGALLVVVVSVIAVWPPATPEPRDVDWASHARGPTDGVRVIWVGHSLMNARDDHRDGGKNMMELVAELASTRGDAHAAYDHTLYGAPLSLLWRGSPHSYTRDEPQMRDRRRELFGSDELEAEYDTIVLTEGIPVEASEEREHTAYYLQRFYCAFLRKQPAGRVYFYESWPHLQASDPDADYGSPHVWAWTYQVEQSRHTWNRIADIAATGRVVGPELEDHWERFLGRTDGQCSHDAPIFTIPVASAMRALALRLREPHPWTVGPRPLTIEDLFINPYLDWPRDWPTEEALSEEQVARVLSGLRLRYADEDHDDVHPSDLGVYFSALVTYATLYGKTPEGLPGPTSLTALHQLQRFVWDHVRNDPRTGVR